MQGIASAKDLPEWISAQKRKNGPFIFRPYWISSLILIKDLNGRRSE
jgi:hypothetical protein